MSLRSVFVNNTCSPKVEKETGDSLQFFISLVHSRDQGKKLIMDEIA